MQDAKITVHDEYESLCVRMQEYPSDHSEVVCAMRLRIEAELAKLPRSKAVPYRRRSGPDRPREEEEERRVTSRVSAAGTETAGGGRGGGVTAASKRALAFPDDGDGEEEVRAPYVPALNGKHEAALERENMERDVRRYHHILNQAAGIQHTALSQIATIVHQMM